MIVCFVFKQKTAYEMLRSRVGSEMCIRDSSGNGQGTTFTVEQGAYKVTEDADEGYATTYAGDCEGTITAGQNLTCTVTNNDLPIIPSDVATGTIRIIKNLSLIHI